MKKLSILLVAGVTSTASAGGFNVNEFDARAVGRGDANVATDTDASSIFYNVGGLAAGEGTSALVTATLLQINARYTENGTGQTFGADTSPQPTGGAFVTSRINDVLAVGLGVSTPFGLAGQWPDDAPTNDIIHKETLRTFFVTPALGANLGSYVPGLTIGGGVDFVPATVDLQQDIFFGTETGTARLGASAFGVGGRVGVMYNPHAAPRLSLGAMWRSMVKENFSGTGNFNAPAPFRAALPPDGPATASFTLPQQVVAGAAYRPIDGLEVEANYVWTNWSTFKQLDIFVPSPTGMGNMQISQPAEWRDTSTVRVGVEYALPQLNAALRAGYIWDQTPVPPSTLSVLVPDHNRNDISAGGSLTFGNYFLHAALLYVINGSQTTSDTPLMPVHKGVYELNVLVGSVSFGGRFGASK